MKGLKRVQILFSLLFSVCLSWPTIGDSHAETTTSYTLYPLPPPPDRFGNLGKKIWKTLINGEPQWSDWWIFSTSHGHRPAHIEFELQEVLDSKEWKELASQVKENRTQTLHQLASEVERHPLFSSLILDGPGVSLMNSFDSFFSTKSEGRAVTQRVQNEALVKLLSAQPRGRQNLHRLEPEAVRDYRTLLFRTPLRHGPDNFAGAKQFENWKADQIAQLISATFENQSWFYWELLKSHAADESFKLIESGNPHRQLPVTVLDFNQLTRKHFVSQENIGEAVPAGYDPVVWIPFGGKAWLLVQPETLANKLDEQLTRVIFNREKRLPALALFCAFHAEILFMYKINILTEALKKLQWQGSIENTRAQLSHLLQTQGADTPGLWKKEILRAAPTDLNDIILLQLSLRPEEFWRAAELRSSGLPKASRSSSHGFSYATDKVGNFGGFENELAYQTNPNPNLSFKIPSESDLPTLNERMEWTPSSQEIYLSSRRVWKVDPTTGLFPIPVPLKPGYQLTSDGFLLEVRWKEGGRFRRQTLKSTDVTLVGNSKSGLLAFDFSHHPEVKKLEINHLELGFGRQQPQGIQAFPFYNLKFSYSQMRPALDELQAIGAIALQQQLSGHFAIERQITDHEIQSMIAKNSCYAIHDLTQLDRAERISDFRELVDPSDQKFVMQCKPSATLLRAILNQALTRHSKRQDIEVVVITVLEQDEGKPGRLVMPPHSIVEIRYRGRPLYHLDSTPPLQTTRPFALKAENATTTSQDENLTERLSHIRESLHHYLDQNPPPRLLDHEVLVRSLKVLSQIDKTAKRESPPSPEVVSKFRIEVLYLKDAIPKIRAGFESDNNFRYELLKAGLGPIGVPQFSNNLLTGLSVALEILNQLKPCTDFLSEK